MSGTAVNQAPAKRGSGEQVRPAEAIDYDVTPGFTQLLAELGCSLVISNYQSSTVMCFSVMPDGRPVQMFAPFAAAMGLALEGDRLAVAAKDEVVVLANVRTLAESFPKFPGFFDGYFVPRRRYVTGECDLHDMAFTDDGILAVNTRYSCLCRIGATMHAFEPTWQPPFISAIGPGDRCHLNGMAIHNGAPRYVTALGTTDTPRGWTEHKLSGGVLMETPSGEIVAHSFCMPHSPRLIGGELFLVEAGTGKLLTLDLRTGGRTEIVALPGFARGLAEHRGYLFVGLSLVRESLGFKNLPIENSGRELICGVVAIELATGKVLGTLRYIGGCSEIHDIQVMAGTRWLGISGCEAEATRLAVNLPAENFWLAPESSEEQGP